MDLTHTYTCTYLHLHMYTGIFSRRVCLEPARELAIGNDSPFRPFSDGLYIALLCTNCEHRIRKEIFGKKKNHINLIRHNIFLFFFSSSGVYRRLPTVLTVRESREREIIENEYYYKKDKTNKSNLFYFILYILYIIYW